MNEDIESLKTEIKELKSNFRKVTCAYCGLIQSMDEPDAAAKLADHIMTCDKNPLTELVRQCGAIAEEYRVEADKLKKLLNKTLLKLKEIDQIDLNKDNCADFSVANKRIKNFVSPIITEIAAVLED